MHFTRGRDVQRAVQYLQYAGENAFQRSAYPETLQHLTQGLEQLQTLPETPARARQELALLLVLGPALMFTTSQAAPEAEHVWTRARALCQQVGEMPQLFQVLVGLRTVYQLRGELLKSRELGEELLRLSSSAQDPLLLASTHIVLAETLFYLGEMAPAQASLDQTRALFEARQTPAAVCRAWDQSYEVPYRYIAAWLSWWLGFPDQALQWSHEAIRLAQALAHPYRLSFALYYAGMLHGFRRENQAAHAHAKAVLALARQHGFPGLLARGMILRGWAQAAQGQSTEGVAQLRQGLAAYHGAGLRLLTPWVLAILAEASRHIGRAAAGLAMLQEARGLVYTYEARFYEAELHRLTGECLWQQAGAMGGTPAPMATPLCGEGQGGGAGRLSPHAEAEGWLRDALAVARQQGAKSLELRAAMSLARLWQQQGQQTEARALLAPIYGWFTEGFDTADLQEAKALLEALGG
jgi:predicted ATPase